MNAKRLLAGLAGLLLVGAALLISWSSRARATGGAARAAEAPKGVDAGATARLARAEELGGATADDSAALEGPAVDESTLERTAVAAAPTAASEDRATIVVRFVALETGVPLEGRRCSVREASASSWFGLFVDSAEGGLGDLPRSGADGIVGFRVPPGSYVVHPETRAVEPRGVEALAAGETREVTFAVPTSCDTTAYVRAIDAESGAPLANVEITLADIPEELADATRSARTDADGRASFRIPSWQDARGELDPVGYNPVRFSLGSEHGSPETALELRVRRSATLRGRVVDDADAPLAGVEAVLQCDARQLGADDALGSGLLRWSSMSSAGSKPSWTAKTGANGEFELVELPSGVGLGLSLRRGSDVLRQERVRLEPGEVRDAVYRIGTGATIRGFLLDEKGAPCTLTELWLVPGASSRMLERRDKPEDATRTTDDGSFELPGVRPGDWILGPSKQSFSVKWMTHVEVPEDVPAIDVLLRLPRMLPVGGHTVDTAGHPIAGVALTAYGDGIWGNTKSGADGAFRFEAFPEGPVTLDAGHGVDEMIGSEPVQARAGDTDVVVVLVEGAEILVHVRDEAGRPLAAEVQTTRADVHFYGTQTTHSDGEGVGRLRRLPAGLFGVIVRVESGLVGTAGPVRLEAGSHVELDVIARAGGRLRVHLPPTAGPWLSVQQDGMIVEFLHNAGAAVVTTSPLPPGAVTVEIAGADESNPSREATVVAGETVDVVFD